MYPGDVGTSMAVYRCPGGGDGWHLGHRDAQVERQSRWPETWTDAERETACAGCPTVVEAGEPLAWWDHRPHCFDCGDQAEREALVP